jgi:hypothetical protein
VPEEGRAKLYPDPRAARHPLNHQHSLKHAIAGSWKTPCSST